MTALPDYKRAYEIKAAHAEKWQPCPGHRGKVDAMKDGCPWCRADVLALALAGIARDRTDNGRPLAAEVAREKARKVLVSYGISWSED